MGSSADARLNEIVWKLEGGVHAFVVRPGSSEADSPISSDKVVGCFVCSGILARCNKL